MQLIKKYIYKKISINENEDNRNRWLKEKLASLPKDSRILDAGAGQLRNKPLCQHLNYVSQDICEYEGNGDSKGLHTGAWDTSGIDLICDIIDIPENDASFDVILCSEVFEHLPEPLKALDEFNRLLKPGGVLILTAPFASFVHFAPYHYATGFSKYWYEHHLPIRNFDIAELAPNGNWFTYIRQEMFRLPSMTRKYGTWYWPISYLVGSINYLYLSLINKQASDEIACFGWHCVAIKTVNNE